MVQCFRWLMESKYSLMINEKNPLLFMLKFLVNILFIIYFIKIILLLH